MVRNKCGNQQGSTLIDRRAEHGFTLIELSIVLVIIGLIVAGILVGQDMIKAAQIRATVAQYEKYNSAVNTFRSKYNGLPGDLANAVSFGMTNATTGNGVVAGDSILQSSNGTVESSTTVAGMETTLFWEHLSAAGLVDTSLATAGAGAAVSLTAATVGNYFPLSKLGRGNYWLVFNANGLNYYELTNIASTDGSGNMTLATNMTPIEAYEIDTKVDDGAPASGVAQADHGTTGLNIAAAYVGGDACVQSATSYLVDTTAHANTLACQLRLRFN